MYIIVIYGHIIRYEIERGHNTCSEGGLSASETCSDRLAAPLTYPITPPPRAKTKTVHYGY